MKQRKKTALKAEAARSLTKKVRGRKRKFELLPQGRRYGDAPNEFRFRLVVNKE